VKSFYKALACQEVFYFSWKSIWRVKAPSRVSFFVWTAALGKILTHDNLCRRHIAGLSGAICARRVENPLTTFYFTAMLHGLYGAIFYFF
jgi:hypothetical protein